MVDLIEDLSLKVSLDLMGNPAEALREETAVEGRNDFFLFDWVDYQDIGIWYSFVSRIWCEGFLYSDLGRVIHLGQGNLWGAGGSLPDLNGVSWVGFQSK